MKALHALGSAVLPLCLASCTIGSPDDNFRANAEKSVSAHLKDPGTARFREEFIVRKPADENGYARVAACGVVDGKNSFNAYTGGARFIAHGIQGNDVLDIAVVQFEDADRRATPLSDGTDKPATIFEQVYWNNYCVDDTHPASYTGVSRT